MADPLEQTNPDPELRAALKRLHGGHVAAAELRQRVATLLASPPPPEAGDEDTAPPQVAGRIGVSPARSRWVRPLGVAAGLLLVIGVTAVYLHERHEQHEREEYVAVNRNVLKAMIATHVEPASAPAADQVADLSNAKAVQAELSRRLSREVPTPDLSSSGWQLQSAGVVSFKSHPAARFEFARAGHRATLLSVPTKAFYGADDDDTYDATIDGHAISGYVEKHGVHCIVGDAAMPLEEITALRKKLQSL